MSQSYIPVPLRREVIERAGACCEYCRLRQGVGLVDFVIDHTLAEKHGGPTTSDNLSFTCYWCNSYKGSDISSVDWEEGGKIVPLYNPRQQLWDEHFVLQGPHIQALSSTGRATLFLLRLNSPERLAERELLLALGDYPC
jgi:hypothetical protein